MSRYEPRHVAHGSKPMWVVFDTQKNAASSEGGRRAEAQSDCDRLNKQTPAPRTLRRVDAYRAALMLISRNSADLYAQEVSTRALEGGYDD